MSKRKTQTPSRIIGVQFSLLSPAEIRKNAVVEVVSRDTYANNKPSVGGLFDARMGVLEPGMLCPTDGLTYIDSPGYFGCIELARPVFFIQHLKDIVKMCKCICFKCSKLLISKTKNAHLMSLSNEDRWAEVVALTATIKRCGDRMEDGCGCKQPARIKVTGMASIYAIWDIASAAPTGAASAAPTGAVDVQEDAAKTITKLTPEIIIRMFRRISNDDVAFMGFSPIWSRPEWMVCEVLPVPPPAVRPSVKHDAQQRSEDDLTHIYSNIIKNNNTLHDKMNTPETSAKIVDDWTDILQHSVAMVVNNNIKGIAPITQQRSGRKLQCIAGRINSKHGRIRGNLMGKRVDYSARSVITGDPNLSILQLGMPMKIAMNVTRPVTVNARNRAFLATLVANGPDVYPGAKILGKKGSDDISLRYVDSAFVFLEIGDVVHRHLMDGDAVLFNRQPSLHRMSMMCHIVKVMREGDTFRMNVGDTKPYNADFDGDEMNAHIAQNILADTELRHLAAIQHQLISPTNNSPTIGIFQDSMLGSYMITAPNKSFSAREAMNLLMSFNSVDVDALRANMTPDFTISNFDVLSQIFPPMTMCRRTNLFGDAEDFDGSNNVLEIRNGKYLRGQLEKSEIGSTTKGLLHRICNDFSNNACAKFNDDLQNIVTEYMKTASYSVGIRDLSMTDRTRREIAEIMAAHKSRVAEIVESVHIGTFRNETASSNSIEFEMRVLNELSDATKKAGAVSRKSLAKDNRFLMIVESGSKGSLLNVSQMVSCLGQQSIEGKRVPYGFDSRTLPHFCKYDDSPAARGFVENSYITGLSSTELFFHAMTGRMGLIDTACKTSSTGYIQRRMVKGLEDLKVEYDMTVRNSAGKIIQFEYGEDGFDSVRVERQSVPLVKMSMEDIYMHFNVADTASANDRLSIYTKPTAARMRKQKDAVAAKCAIYIDKMIVAREDLVTRVFKYRDGDTVYAPIAFEYLIANVQGQFGLDARSLVDITPLEAFELIELYGKKLHSLYYHRANDLFDTLYFFYLSPKSLLVSRRLHRQALIVLLETIVLKFREAMVHPGECVGIIAAQSLGEPTTQLTLNTFHHSGVASKSNVIRGVPRIEEILHLTRNPKKPSITIFLNEKDETSRDKVMARANMIEYTCLGDMVASAQILFDPNDLNTIIESDRRIMEQYQVFETMIAECSGTGGGSAADVGSKWVVRLAMSKEKMLDKNITMEDVHFAITNSSFGGSVICAYADYNDDNLIFRLRVASSVLAKGKRRGAAESLDMLDDIYVLKAFQESMMNNIVLRGIPGITGTTLRTIQNNVRKKDGQFVKTDIWVLDTIGANLLDVLALDCIDARRTTCGDIRKVFEVLGIEAARQTIHNEFMEVMFTNDNVYINYHHISLLCDRMTCNKNMVPIFRTGLLKDNTGTFAKASYESQSEVLMAAARHGLVDTMRGVSASVFVGDTGFYGTSAFQLVLDMRAMEARGERSAQLRDEVKEIEAAFLASAPDVGECAKKAIAMVPHPVAAVRPVAVCNDEYDAGF